MKHSFQVTMLLYMSFKIFSNSLLINGSFFDPLFFGIKEGTVMVIIYNCNSRSFKSLMRF